MAWTLYYESAAEKELSKLDKGKQRAIVKYLDECCQLSDPTDRGHALTGQWAGFHRYRLGQLRVIVKIVRAKLVIAVIELGRRDSVY